jgi:fluoride exporter
VSRPSREVAQSDPFAAGVRPGTVREQAPVVAAVAAGGAIGACARYGATLLWPTTPGGFPWTTLAVNVSGCALMGVVMVMITAVWAGRRLLRPLLGTGILGGYTTFSAYTGEIEHLVSTGHALPALTYLVATPVAALAATWSAATITRRLLSRRMR